VGSGQADLNAFPENRQDTKPQHESLALLD
jgi:hypothetical protein